MKQIILKKIGHIISEIQDQYQYLSENPDSLNELELELFVANSHFLSEHLSILRKIYENEESQLAINHSKPITAESVPAQIPVEIQQPEEVTNSKVEPEPEPLVSDWSFKLESENVDEEKSEIGEEFEIADAETELSEQEMPFIIERKNTDEVMQPVESRPVIPARINRSTFTNAEQIKDFEGSKSEKAPENIKPEFSESSQKIPTINDLLATRSAQNTVATQFRNNSGNDLKKIISLNDKLLFVKDLFNGYSLAYSEAIELLNRYDNFEEANKFLQQNYAVKNKWSEKQITADKFYEVLNRKFN